MPHLVVPEEVNEEASGAIEVVAEGTTQGANVEVQTRQLNIVKGGIEGATEGGNAGAPIGVQTGQINVVEGDTKGVVEAGTEGGGGRVQTSLFNIRRMTSHKSNAQTETNKVSFLYV